MNQVERIQEMERIFDKAKEAVSGLSEALEAFEGCEKELKKLEDYYAGARWMKDFEDDEAGKLPADLKRGVLSEDGVYDLLTENRENLIRMLKICTRAAEKHLI